MRFIISTIDITLLFSDEASFCRSPLICWTFCIELTIKLVCSRSSPVLVNVRLFSSFIFSSIFRFSSIVPCKKFIPSA